MWRESETFGENARRFVFLFVLLFARKVFKSSFGASVFQPIGGPVFLESLLAQRGSGDIA